MGLRMPSCCRWFEIQYRATPYPTEQLTVRRSTRVEEEEDYAGFRKLGRSIIKRDDVALRAARSRDFCKIIWLSPREAGDRQKGACLLRPIGNPLGLILTGGGLPRALGLTKILNKESSYAYGQ